MEQVSTFEFMLNRENKVTLTITRNYYGGVNISRYVQTLTGSSRQKIFLSADEAELLHSCLNL